MSLGLGVKFSRLGKNLLGGLKLQQVGHPGGTLKIVDGVFHFWISMTTCFRKFGRKRHPALEFLANNNTMWCHIFQNFVP